MGSTIGLIGCITASCTLGAVDTNGLASLIAQIVILILAYFLGGKKKQD